MAMELGALGFAGEITQFLAQKLLVVDVQVLVAEEDDSALGNCPLSDGGRLDRGRGIEIDQPRMAKSRILVSSCKISLS
jgi:hypothetical protein